MAGKGSQDSESFAQTIDRHRELPDDTGKGANADLPQLFTSDFPIPAGESVVENLPQALGKNRSGSSSLMNSNSNSIFGTMSSMKPSSSSWMIFRISFIPVTICSMAFSYIVNAQGPAPAPIDSNASARWIPAG